MNAKAGIIPLFDGIPVQLAALLGHPVKRIRITDEVPPRISVMNLAAAITMKDASQAAEQVAYVKKATPEVTDMFCDFKFRGRGQNNTPARDRELIDLYPPTNGHVVN